MDYRHQHAHIGDLHLEVWVADDWAHSRVENIKTHEQVFVARSKRFEAQKQRLAPSPKSATKSNGNQSASHTHLSDYLLGRVTRKPYKCPMCNIIGSSLCLYFDQTAMVGEFVAVDREGLLLLGPYTRYPEIGNAGVRRFFQFVLVASACGQLSMGRVYLLPAVLHVAGEQRPLL